MHVHFKMCGKQTRQQKMLQRLSKEIGVRSWELENSGLRGRCCPIDSRSPDRSVASPCDPAVYPAASPHAVFIGSLFILRPIVWDYIIPFIGRGAGDKGDDGFGVAHVEDFMGHPGLDVNKIAGFVLHHLFAAVSELVADFSFDDVKD